METSATAGMQSFAHKEYEVTNTFESLIACPCNGWTTKKLGYFKACTSSVYTTPPPHPLAALPPPSASIVAPILATVAPALATLSCLLTCYLLYVYRSV